MAEALGGESGPELDRDGPDRETRGERVEPEGSIGEAALADGGGGGGVRGGGGGRGCAVRREGHVLREGWRGDAREGGEPYDGGLGWEARDGEGQHGHFAEGNGE